MNIVSSEFNFLIPFYYPNLIRLGNKNDGGYILPEGLLHESDGLLSFGYGYDSSFENDYIEKTNNSIEIYDHTCGYINLIKPLLRYFKRFLLFRKKLTDVQFHFLNLSKHHKFVSSKSVNFFKKKIVKNKKKSIEISVDKILRELKFKNAILKCDIEGGEYDIIDEVVNKHTIFNCILIEFHQIKDNIDKFKDTIKKLSHYYSIVHLHGNNHDPLLENINIPSTLEITLIKKGFVKTDKNINKFPNKSLDNPNNPSLEDLEFEFKI